MWAHWKYRRIAHIYLLKIAIDSLALYESRCIRCKHVKWIFLFPFFTFVKFNHKNATQLQSELLKSISTRFIRVFFLHENVKCRDRHISFDFLIAFDLASFAHKTNHCYAHLSKRKIVILHIKFHNHFQFTFVESKRLKRSLCLKNNDSHYSVPTSFRSVKTILKFCTKKKKCSNQKRCDKSVVISKTHSCACEW